MSFVIEHGDLFAHPAEALAHGVNCRGYVGGLASAMADRYASAMLKYSQAAYRGDLRPGQALLTSDRSGRVIIHCASQREPGPDATEQWLRESLTAGLEQADEHGIASVAVPLIGGGIGGLDPAVAEQAIREVAEASPVAVTLVLPQ